MDKYTLLLVGLMTSAAFMIYFFLICNIHLSVAFHFILSPIPPTFQDTAGAEARQITIIFAWNLMFALGMLLGICVRGIDR